MVPISFKLFKLIIVTINDAKNHGTVMLILLEGIQMNLNNLSETELISKTKFISNEEKRLTAELLHYLAEIERRRLFAKMGYKSIFDLCVKYLNYGESSAWRRIDAMRLLKDVPSVEGKIIDGTLTLTNVSAISTFLRKDKTYTKEKKEELVKTIENKSKKEVEKIIAKLSPMKELPREKEKPLNETKTQIQFNADNALLNKLKTIKEKLGFSKFNITYEELINQMADITLEKISKLEKKRENLLSPEKVKNDSR